jgi:hypothetical protein
MMPIALTVSERSMTVTPVCKGRTLAAGRPPAGIACVQEGFARVYPLRDDPEQWLETFFEEAAAHAMQLARELHHRETSVEHFLEISDGGSL